LLVNECPVLLAYEKKQKNRTEVIQFGLGSGLTEMEFSGSRIGGLEGVEGNE
jgi:hypothetical protein